MRITSSTCLKANLCRISSNLSCPGPETSNYFFVNSFYFRGSENSFEGSTHCLVYLSHICTQKPRPRKLAQTVSVNPQKNNETIKVNMMLLNT